MSDADFRLIPPIPITGEGSFSRASSATYFDKNGVLQTAGLNEFRVTYDPADLSAPPRALVEKDPATNYALHSEAFDNAAWTKNTANVVSNALLAPDGTNTADFIGATGPDSYVSQAIAVAPGETYTFSVWLCSVNPTPLTLYISDNGGGGNTGAPCVPDSTWRRYSVTRTLSLAATGGLFTQIGGANSFTSGENVYAWGAQLDLGPVARSYVKTTNAAVTRAADVVGSATGLLHSNVPEPEPLWVAGTYALGVIVRDAQHVAWESLAANNTAPLPTETNTFWGRVGATARYKMFDKVVNSRTVAPDVVTFTLATPGVANTLMLLNLAGTSVTISQLDSGYSKTKSLVRHEVSNWYDFFYQEPIRAGDAVFEAIPPYPGSPITVTVLNPGAEAAIGCALLSKAIVLGKTMWELAAGALSYSTPGTDPTTGNVTMKKRPSARRMNLEVAIPKGFETEAYRLLTTYTDVEIGVIAATQYEMTYSYGFIGQWEIPLSITGKKAPIEFRGLQ